MADFIPMPSIFLALLLSTSAIGATPWETYVAMPSPEHAKLVSVPTYSSAETRNSDGPGRFEQDLRVLGEQIRNGDAESFYLGLRVRKSPEADGALAEFLDFTVASFLRVRPSEFLNGLIVYGSHDCSEAVYTDPDIYADRLTLQSYEFKRRLETIEHVRIKRLAGMRDLCIHALRTEIERVESHFQTP